MKKPTPFSADDFARAYMIAAQLIVDMGEKYLPIIKRLHEEKDRIEADLCLANLALQIVQPGAE